MPTHTLWRTLPPAFSNNILVDLQKTNKKLYRTATDLIAPRMGIRVPIMMEMPKVERHTHWANILSYPQMEALSFNILSGWLIETQRPMLCAWLDSLGIAHGENGCADSFPPQPEVAKLKAGVDHLLEKFDAQTVSLYLTCFNEIDEVRWPALADILVTDSRLQFTAPEPAA